MESNSALRGLAPQATPSRASGVGAALASNSAVAELVKELDRTRKEYSRSLLQLAQLQGTVQSFQQQVDDKDATIADLERKLTEMNEENRARQREEEERHAATGTALAHRARHLEVEMQRLQRENESMSKLEADNTSLRETILDCQANIERLRLANQDLLQRMKDGGGAGGGRGGNAAASSPNRNAGNGGASGGGGGSAYEDLEAQFQKKLAVAEKKFRAEAYKALSEEAKSALQGNDHLQIVLKRQNDSIEMVLARCKQLEEAHDEVLRQNEDAGQHLNQHMKEAQRLAQQLEETRSKNRLLDEAMKQRKVERASLELLYVEYEQQKKKLQLAEEKARRSAREAARWHDRAVQLTHELSADQRAAAEKKLAQIEGVSFTIEDNARREELRAETRRRAQLRQQEGARTLRAITEGGNDSYTGIGSELTMFQSGGGRGVASKNATQRGIEEDVSAQMGICTDDILALWRATDQQREDPSFGNVDAVVSGIVSNGPTSVSPSNQQMERDATEGGPTHSTTDPTFARSVGARGTADASSYPHPPPIVSTADIRRSHQQQPKPIKGRSVAEEVAERNKQLSRVPGGGARGLSSANNRLPAMPSPVQAPSSADPRPLDSLAEARRTIKAAPLPAGARHYAVPPVRRTEEYNRLVGRTERLDRKSVV